MSVWKVKRATSYLLWPSASSPRSKSTLSGCCEFRLASGLLFFFLWCSGQIQALAAIEVTSASTTTARDLRNITTSGAFYKGLQGAEFEGLRHTPRIQEYLFYFRPFAAWLHAPVSGVRERGHERHCGRRWRCRRP